MYKARYYNADGEKGKERALPNSLFDGVVNEGAMHQVVKAYLSNQRQGTASAKSRGEVAGGSRKPWRQKGTGRARQGTIRAVQWSGGGVAFPPTPHSWRERVPKKVKSLARRSALNDRAENDKVVMVDMPALEKPRTKELVGFLGAIDADGKVLVLTDGKNDNLYLSSRNLPNVQVLPFGNESVYDLLWAGTVVIESSALDNVPDLPEAPVKKARPAAKKAKPKAKKKAAPKAKKAAAQKETPEAEKAEAKADKADKADETEAETKKAAPKAKKAEAKADDDKPAAKKAAPKKKAAAKKKTAPKKKAAAKADDDKPAAKKKAAPKKKAAATKKAAPKKKAAAKKKAAPKKKAAAKKNTKKKKEGDDA